MFICHECDSLDGQSHKQLLKLDRPAQVRVRDAVSGLSEFPHTRNTKKLANHFYGYRLRIGDYRVLFDFDGEIKIVTVEEVKKRDESTY